MRKRYLLIVCFFSCAVVKAQSDFQWWPLVNVCKSKGNFKFFFEEQIRFRNTASQLYVIYSDLGVRYRINDYLCLGPIYRPIWSKKEDVYNQSNRFLFDFIFRNNVQKLEYSFRTRYQTLIRVSDGDPREHYSRNKFELRYHSKVRIVLSSELFNPLFKTAPGFIDKIRNTLGFEIPVTAHSCLYPQLMYIKDRNADQYADLFIMGGGYYLYF